MSQQLQQPRPGGQQGIGGQSQTQQFGGSQQSGGLQAGGQQSSGQQVPTMPGVEPTQQLPTELRTFLTDVGHVIDVLEWTKVMSLQSGPQAASIVQVVDDTASVGRLVKDLVARDSVLVPQATGLFVQSAQQTLGMLQGQQGQIPGIERATWKLRETLESAQRVQQQYGGGQGSQQQGFGQSEIGQQGLQQGTQGMQSR